MCIDIVGATFVREVENGEIVVIEKHKLKKFKTISKTKIKTLCI